MCRYRRQGGVRESPWEVSVDEQSPLNTSWRRKPQSLLISAHTDQPFINTHSSTLQDCCVTFLLRLPNSFVGFSPVGDLGTVTLSVSTKHILSGHHSLRSSSDPYSKHHKIIIPYLLRKQNIFLSISNAS